MTPTDTVKENREDSEEEERRGSFCFLVDGETRERKGKATSGCITACLCGSNK